MSAARRKLDRAYKRAEALGLADELAELATRAVDSLAASRAQYDDIRWGQEPDGVLVLDAPTIDPAVTELGVLAYVEYEGSKGGEHFIWYHSFEPDQPRLCVNSEGKLLVIGGSYVVTERGIVG